MSLPRTIARWLRGAGQFVSGTQAFGLDSGLARGIRPLFQPLLVPWALWSTGARKAWRESRTPRGGID